MQITFSQLRTVTSDEKRIRQHQLRMYWKAWRDSNQYRKYMMGSEVVTVQFRRNA